MNVNNLYDQRARAVSQSWTEGEGRGRHLRELTDSWIIFNLMNKSEHNRSGEAEINAAIEQSAPRKREKRIISRKSEHSEKSIESRRALQRTPRVNEFIAHDLSSSNIKTPDSRRDRGEAVPRLSFNQSNMKSFITYQPLWKNREGLEVNIQSARDLPRAQSRTEREFELKNQHFLKKIENLKTQLEIRNQEIEVIEEDRQRLRRNNQQLSRNNATLEVERKQLRHQIQCAKQQTLKITTQKKKLEREKQTLEKKIIALQKCSSNESWSLQSNRERYLEREIQELRQRLGKSKSQLEKLLENQVNRYKQELFNSMKTIGALRINNDCLQKKLYELALKPQPKVSPNEQYMKLRNKYKKFLSEYRSLRKQYDDLKDLYDELRCKFDKVNMDKSETIDEDTSLDLSSLN